MRIKNPKSILKGIRRIILSWIVINSLFVMTVVPVFAGLISEKSTVNQPTVVETVSSQETQSSDTSLVDNDDSSIDPSDGLTKTEIETTVLPTDAVEPENPDTSSSDNSTQTVTLAEQNLISGTDINELTVDSTSQSNDENSSSPTAEKVIVALIPSLNNSENTNVQYIDVITSQTYTDISAQITITQQKPQNVPSLELQKENKFVESYVSLDFLADNVILSEQNIQMITITFKIKKDVNNHSNSTGTQIYGLNCQLTPLMFLSEPFIYEITTPYKSGVWEPITPTEIEEDDDFVYYQIETISYYAAYAIVEAEINEIQTYQSSMPQIPWSTIVLTTIIATALLLIVIFKTGFIYRIEEHTDRLNAAKITRETNQKWSYKLKLVTAPPELQPIKSPIFYYPTTSCSPQVLTASTQIQNTSDEREEDPMFL